MTIAGRFPPVSVSTQALHESTRLIPPRQDVSLRKRIAPGGIHGMAPRNFDLNSEERISLRSRHATRGCFKRKIALFSKIMASVYSYARELRTIGQQLEKQRIDIFDLLYVDGDYHLECANPNPPFTDIVHLRYTDFELKSLEIAAAHTRSSGFMQVDFQGLAELLRATGRYVERLNAKLLRISVPDSGENGALFKIEYQTRDGRQCFEDIRADALADLTIRMYKERARISGPRDHRSGT